MRKRAKKTRTCTRFGFVLEGKTFPEKVGARIKEIREKRRLTISSVARYLKIDEALIRRWEAGYLIPPEHHLSKLAFLLGVEEPWLLHAKGYYLEIGELTGAADVPGLFLTAQEERAFHLSLKRAEQARAEEEQARMAQMFAEQEAAEKLKAERLAAQQATTAAEAEKKRQRAERMRFETPYYRAQRAKQEAEAKHLLYLLDGMSDDEQAEFLFLRDIARAHRRGA